MVGRAPHTTYHTGVMHHLYWRASTWPMMGYCVHVKYWMGQAYLHSQNRLRSNSRAVVATK